MNTDTNLLEWVKTVSDLADSLQTSTGVAVTAERKKRLLLAGLLPEFKMKKQWIHSQDKDNTLSFADCVDDLTDFAKEENLMNLKKGTFQKRNQTFMGQDSKFNGQSRNVPQKKMSYRDNLATQQCRQWTAGTCIHGANCYRRHDGPGGCAKETPVTKPQKPTSMLPIPSAPLLICQYCSTNGHVLQECPQFIRSVKEESGETMFTSAEPAYTFPVVEEELPENEQSVESSYLKYFMLSLAATITTIFFFMTDGFIDVRRTLKSFVGWRGVLIVLIMAVLVSYSAAAPIPQVRSSSYFDEENSSASNEYQWVADSGTNRFVTNDINDFMPGSVVHTQTNVAVGGGSTISPCFGSVLVRGLDHNVKNFLAVSALLMEHPLYSYEESIFHGLSVT